MLRVIEEAENRSRLYYLAQVHHGDIVGDLRDNSEVVCDEEDRHSLLLLYSEE